MPQSSAAASRTRRPLVTQAPSEAPAEIDLLEVVKREFWLIAMFVSAGIAAAVWYSMSAEVWYESTAKVLVSQRDPRTATNGMNEGGAEVSVDDNVLANHMEVVQSRLIIDAALDRKTSEGVALRDLPSLQAQLDDDADTADYVVENLSLNTGGSGAAKAARSLNAKFEHTDPIDAKLILTAIVMEYQAFLDKQLEDVSSHAARLVNDAKREVEAEVREAEKAYIEARRNAPLLFTGEGSGNLYVDKFRKVEDELLDIEIQELSVSTRLENVRESLQAIEESDGSDLEKMALIDSESLERIGFFAQLQMSATNSVEFQAAQADRVAGARTEYDKLLALKAEQREMESTFGPNYGPLRTIKDEIAMIEGFLDEKQSNLPSLLENADISPKTLLSAYVGFLVHDLASLAERKKELQIVSRDAEESAKKLIDFELRDQQLRDEIERKRALYDGIVEQLRDLDTASAFSGFIHELLESPDDGERSWPSLPLCLLAGSFLGLLAGVAVAFLKDGFDDRFRSSKEVENTLDTPILATVPALEKPEGSKHRLAATTLSQGGESFRTMRTILQPGVRSGKLRSIAVTSAVPGDGKSLMMANLAVAFSQTGLNVLVIDADMRRPVGHDLFNVKERVGLGEILSGEGSLADLAVLTEHRNLSFLPAGRHVTNPAELLQSKRFKTLLEEAKQSYGIVLIDVGPALAVSDPIIVGQHVDGMIFVTRIAKDRKGQASSAVERLRSGGVRVLGTIINTVGASAEFEAGKNYYGDYYKSTSTTVKSTTVS